MEKFLLSFEINDEKDILKIHGDEKGFKHLIEKINNLINNANEESFNHDHLFSPKNGGNDLSEKNMGESVIGHVKIYFWKEDDKKN